LPPASRPERNVLLRTRLLRYAISGDSTSLRLDYESAYSIIPGRVHLEGLIIRGRGRTVEWLLTLDHVDVAISLFDLLRRRFHATRVRSNGLAIRVRLRLDPVNATPHVIAALPPIAGFADPPLLDYGPEPPPLTDANYHLWMVDLEDVDVEHVHEVWIQTGRSEGDTRVRGRWLFRPKRWLDVGPATVEANGVDLFYGSHPLATGLRGAIEGTVTLAIAHAGSVPTQVDERMVGHDDEGSLVELQAAAAVVIDDFELAHAIAHRPARVVVGAQRVGAGTPGSRKPNGEALGAVARRHVGVELAAARELG
jgi:hypothetical protein